MLTSSGCRARQERLRSRLEGAWDAVVIGSPEHVLYLANFFALPNSLNAHSTSYLLLEKDGRATLFTDNWLGPAAKQHVTGAEPAVDEVVTVEWYTCERPALDRAQAVGSAVRDRLVRLKARSIAGELARLPQLVASAAAAWIDAGPTLRKLRELKDADEVEAIRLGVRTAEEAQKAARQLVRPGMTELELYGHVLARCVITAGGPFVMMCDLASGSRAAEGGGGPTSRVMREGETVIVDTFPYVLGYRGDITNTLAVGGRPSREQEHLFGTVLEGLKAAEKLLGPGSPVREIHAEVGRVFRAADPKWSLVHHAGHAIGLGHPEAPELVPGSDRVLEKGMVITVEPGIYGQPWGGVRLEHDYLIVDGGFERLSNHSLGLA